MALTRQKKQAILDDYAEGLADAKHAFILGYQGISVPQVTTLRSRIRAQGAKYVVIKNTLALRAVDGRPLAKLGDRFSGPTAIAFGGEDPVALAKVLTEFAKEAPVLQFKGALLEGQALDGAAVKEIAALPGREELIAKLLYLLQSPITRFVRVLAAVPQQFVAVLDQVRQQKEQQG